MPAIFPVQSPAGPQRHCFRRLRNAVLVDALVAQARIQDGFRLRVSRGAQSDRRAPGRSFHAFVHGADVTVDRSARLSGVPLSASCRSRRSRGSPEILHAEFPMTRAGARTDTWRHETHFNSTPRRFAATTGRARATRRTRPRRSSTRSSPRQCFASTSRRSNAGPIPRRLSLYVHVPFCFSPCFYCGCNRIITRDTSRARPTCERLQREIAMLGPLFDRDREVVQVHLGGGTPNFMRAGEIGELMQSLGHHFRLSATRERDFSIELDPRHVAAGRHRASMRGIGFNRASLGVQDFDPAVQRAVNRIQSVEETLRVIDACRAEGFRSINVDLIYGLPNRPSRDSRARWTPCSRAGPTGWRFTATRISCHVQGAAPDR